MSVNDTSDLKGITEVSQIAKHLREMLRENCRPGVSTSALDEICRKELKAVGAVSAPMTDYNAPCYAFYSVNDCIVHGLPNRSELVDGDLVKIDVTPKYNGFVADTACSVVVGNDGNDTLAARLVASVERSFQNALGECRVGSEVNRIGRTIERTTTADGFFVTRELAGHGVGRAIHEEPSVYNYYEPRQRMRLTEGLVIAIEPMITSKRSAIRTTRDDWSIVASRGTLTAHYEHTVLITHSGPVVLTA
ncbi:MAG: type I methionyl aminopeptidase [Bacteroidota bacterium]